MSSWRWDLFRVSQFFASGLILVTRALAYATAGALTKKELGGWKISLKAGSVDDAHV